MAESYNLFLSWSGRTSEQVARALRSWIPDVIQGLSPWMSQVDIAAGVFWDAQMRATLAGCEAGVICVTEDNLSSPWLNYEAGALAESLQGPAGGRRVVPLLFGIDVTEVSGPLTRLQMKTTTESGCRDMMLSLNAMLVNPVDSARVERSFDRSWPELKEKLTSIEAALSKKSQGRKTDINEKIDEILVTVRGLAVQPRNAIIRATGHAPQRYAGPALLVEVIDIEDPIEVGRIETYEITVKNQGGAPATNVQVVAEWEAVFEFVDVVGFADIAPSRRERLVDFGVWPVLAPAEQIACRVRLRGVAPADARFTARVRSAEFNRWLEETEATNIYA